MTREELEHAIRAACEIAQDDAVFVFGSQAILGQFPEAPAAFRERDRDFVRTLLVERMVDQAVLLGRIGALDLRTDERDRRATWVRRTGSEL